MENENIAGGVVNLQQARVNGQIAIAALKQDAVTQETASDTIASSVSRVGDIISPGQAVTQSSRLLDQSA